MLYLEGDLLAHLPHRMGEKTGGGRVKGLMKVTQPVNLMTSGLRT